MGDPEELSREARARHDRSAMSGALPAEADAAPSPSISVVVPVNGPFDVVDQCLDALYSQVFPAERYEVLAVANGVSGAAADEMRAVMARWQPSFGPRLRLLDVGEASIARARNEGIAHARGQVVMQINQDSLLARTALAEHYAAHEGYRFDPLCVVVGGRRFPSFLMASLFNYLYEVLWLYSPLHRPMPPFRADYMWFVTCNQSCTREAYIRFGGYDPAYVWGSDTALGKLWETLHGVRTYVHTAIASFHLHRLSFDSWKRNALKRAPYACKMQAGMFPDELKLEQRLAVKTRLDGAEINFEALDRDIAQLEQEFTGQGHFQGATLLGRRIADLEELALRLRPLLGAYQTYLEFGEIWRLAQAAHPDEAAQVAAAASSAACVPATQMPAAEEPVSRPPAFRAASRPGPQVTVLLTNYQRPQNLGPILECLTKQTVPVQVFLWNNAGDSAPPAAAEATAKAAAHPLVRLSVTASRNMRCWPRWLMASMADTEFVCTLDDDLVFADDRVLEDAIKAATELCPEGVVGFFGWQQVPGKSYRDCLHVNGSRVDRWVDFIKGRFMFLRRVLLERVPLAHPVFRDVESLLRRADDFYVNLCISGGRREAHLVPGTLGKRYEELWDHGVGMMHEPGHREERGELVRRMFDYYGTRRRGVEGSEAAAEPVAAAAPRLAPAAVRGPVSAHGGARAARRRSEHVRADQVHLIYFSCRQHFEYLQASLRSMERLGSPWVGKVFVFMDCDHPLTEAQVGTLEQEVTRPLAITQTKHAMAWGGPYVIANERIAFDQVAKQVGPDDYIAKVDSDLIFLSDRTLAEVIETGADMLGQPNLNGCFRYTQGGCYFLKASFVPGLVAQPPEGEIESVARRLGHERANCPEDAVIYSLARRRGGRIRFRSFYLPLYKLGRISEADRERFSVVHFEGCRREMLNVMAREVLPEAFEAAPQEVRSATASGGSG